MKMGYFSVVFCAVHFHRVAITKLGNYFYRVSMNNRG